MTWKLSKAKAMPLLPIGMMLVWMMWRKRFIQGIFLGGIEDAYQESIKNKFDKDYIF